MSRATGHYNVGYTAVKTRLIRSTDRPGGPGGPARPVPAAGHFSGTLRGRLSKPAAHFSGSLHAGNTVAPACDIAGAARRSLRGGRAVGRRRELRAAVTTWDVPRL